jgi:hypothetical protein
MSRDSFRQSIFDVIELMTQMELRTSSKRLILEYFNMSAGQSSRERARIAIERYSQKELPPRAEIIERNKENRLTRLDRLVLTMEAEADRFDKQPE